MIDSKSIACQGEYQQEIIKGVIKTQLQTNILLVGFQDGQAQITDISESESVDFRTINFHAIGSGNMQAINALLFQKHSMNEKLKGTLYNVFKAKRNAEVLEGVGKETDILIIFKNKCEKLKKEQIDVLDNIYQNELIIGKNHPDIEQLYEFFKNGVYEKNKVGKRKVC